MQIDFDKKLWKKMKLGDSIIEIIDGDRGKNYPKQDEFFDQGHCLFLNANNVTISGFSFNKAQFITEEKDKLLRKGKLKRHDVVMTTRGTVGNIAYYDDTISYNHVRINSGMVIFRIPKDQQELYPGYIYQFLKAPFFTEQVASHSSGSAQPQLPIKHIKRLEIILPPLDEQRRIADLLSKIDAAIAQTDQQAQAVLAYRKGLINCIFNQPNDVGTVLPKTYKTMIPFGTVVANVNESERNPLEKGMTHFIGLEHLEPEHLHITTWGNLEDGTTFTKVFRQGQVLFGKRRAYLKKAALADFGGICSGDILVFEANADKLLPGLLPYLVQNDAFFQHAVMTSAGSLSPRTKWKDVANFEFYLPDMERQEKLLDIFTQLEQALEQTKHHAAALTAFKKGLLNEFIG